jgi:hypothetical protein
MYVTTHQALSATDGETAVDLQQLRDRAEIIAALYRFALGQDIKDADLLGSAFSSDAELDFRAPVKWGAQPVRMSGREAIVSGILAFHGPDRHDPPGHQSSRRNRGL